MTSYEGRVTVERNLFNGEKVQRYENKLERETEDGGKWVTDEILSTQHENVWNHDRDIFKHKYPWSRLILLQ
jgi:hypothetical protein